MLEHLLTEWHFHDNQQSAEEQDDELKNKVQANPLCSQFQTSEKLWKRKIAISRKKNAVVTHGETLNVSFQSRDWPQMLNYKKESVSQLADKQWSQTHWAW